MLDVLIVEDDKSFAEILSDRMAEDARFDRIQVATTLTSAREVLLSFKPALVVLDLGLPDGVGTVLLDSLPEGSLGIVLSVFGDESRVLKALAAGAGGYLLKDDEEIIDKLAGAADGGAPMSPRAASFLLKNWRDCFVRRESTSPLSNRETETLQWLAKGCTYKETATKMTISTHTVSDHVKRIYRKLSVGSRAAAVHEALRLGYIATPRSPHS